MPSKMKKGLGCAAKTPLCSNECIAVYGVNGSEKEGTTFKICGPCRAYLGRTNKVTAIQPGLRKRATS